NVFRLVKLLPHVDHFEIGINITTAETLKHIVFLVSKWLETLTTVKIWSLWNVPLETAEYSQKVKNFRALFKALDESPNLDSLTLFANTSVYYNPLPFMPYRATDIELPFLARLTTFK